MRRLVLVLAVCVALHSCSSQEAATRRLTQEFLSSGMALREPVAYTEFGPIPGAHKAGNSFNGRLQLKTVSQQNYFDLQLDTLSLVRAGRPGIDQLPPFDFEFVQDGGYLVPVSTGPVRNDHNWWEYVFGTGQVWDESRDQSWSRAAIPFALKERREDCTHNGVLTFLFRNTGDVSKVAFQVTSQTCSYLQFEMAGLLPATYEPGQSSGHDQVVSAARKQRQSRLAVRSIANIDADYEVADPAAFGSVDEIRPEDMTLFGFLIDDVHYASDCSSRYGNYPFCDEMAIPSYSTAKSIVGGLGLMLLEKAYPGSAGTPIAALVPECDQGWQDVSIEHALDMTTGHFGSPELHGDEIAATNGRFFLSDHAGKIDVACNAFPRKAAPGTHLSYHTWDTYLAGVAMNGVLRKQRGPDADFFDDLLVTGIFEPLMLSPMAANTRRTYDAERQPYTGFGLTLLRDDLAKLARFIGQMDGRIGDADPLYRPLFDAVKQRIPDDAGLVAELDTIRYNNGFRSFDVSSYLGCENPAWVVVLSGFGGIIVAIMPNDTAYYYVSDGGDFRYLTAVRESHRIRPLCT